jgi:hypothetical protein
MCEEGKRKMYRKECVKGGRRKCVKGKEKEHMKGKGNYT